MGTKTNKQNKVGSGEKAHNFQRNPNRFVVNSTVVVSKMFSVWELMSSLKALHFTTLNIGLGRKKTRDLFEFDLEYIVVNTWV